VVRQRPEAPSQVGSPRPHADLGSVGFSEGGPQYLGAQQLTTRQDEEETQRVIDEEVTRLLKEADDRAGALLESRRDALEEVVALLLERETIDGEDVERVLSKERVPTSRACWTRSQARADRAGDEAYEEEKNSFKAGPRTVASTSCP
jgi:Peptidase family M41